MCGRTWPCAGNGNNTAWGRCALATNSLLWTSISEENTGLISAFTTPVQKESSSSTICGLEFQSPNYRTTSLPKQTNSWKHNGNLKLDKQPHIVPSNPTPQSNHGLKQNLPTMFEKWLRNHGDCRKRQSPESIPQSGSRLTLLGTSGKHIVPEFFKISESTVTWTPVKKKPLSELQEPIHLTVKNRDARKGLPPFSPIYNPEKNIACVQCKGEGRSPEG